MSVLTVITHETGAAALARLGFRIARAIEEPLVVLCLEHGEAGEPLAFARGDGPPGDASALLQEVCSVLERRGTPELEERPDREDPAADDKRIVADPEVEVRWLKAPKKLPAVLAQIAEAKATFLAAAIPLTSKSDPEASLARQLFTTAPCHTVLLRPGLAEGDVCRRILVPTAGGPHAEVALRLGAQLASAAGGEVVALNVQADEGELPRAVGERVLAQAIDAADVEDARCVRTRVELGKDRFEVISRVAHEDFDLLLIGESNAGTLRRSLFGTVPAHLLSAEEGMMVAVVRREWKLMHRLRERLGRWLDLTVPQMNRQQRTALYEKLQSGSEWNFDFMALIGLSTAIAALGLLQSSAAVVIGAMLVAPLMTPILGAGLALVQGNLPLLRTAGKAIVYGYLIALLIGLVLGTLFPIPELTPELLARGGPTLLDMGVAFLSGLAAAFCLARPGLLAALPGVAIAAALVPPIATTGISLAIGEGRTAGGAALLFGTNVIAIILGAAVSLYAGGVRGKHGAGNRQRWVRWAFLSLLLGAAVLSVPLGSVLLSQLSGEGRATPAPPALEARLEKRLAKDSGARLTAAVVRREDRADVVEIRLAAPAPVSRELLEELASVAREELGDAQTVRIRTELVVEVP